MPKVYLKSKNRLTLFISLAMNCSLFWTMLVGGTPINWRQVGDQILALNVQDSLFYILSPLLLGVITGIIPPPLKAVLVYWRLKNVLPGCRAFSSLAGRDERIEAEQLRSVIGQRALSPREQNALWFKWYREVEDEMRVLEEHKRFLLFRDLTCMAFLFLLLGLPVLAVIGAGLAVSSAYAALMALQYSVFCVVARNHGNRMVCNVIIEYLQRQPVNQKKESISAGGKRVSDSSQSKVGCSG